MENPFTIDQKVITKIKGVEIEATVRLTWNNEVQVRTPDGKLLWRTVKSVRPMAPVAPSEPSPAPTPVPAPGTEPAPAEPPLAPVETARPDTPQPAPSEPATPRSQAVPSTVEQPVPSAAPQPATDEIIAPAKTAPEVTACNGDAGVPTVNTKRHKKRRK